MKAANENRPMTSGLRSPAEERADVADAARRAGAMAEDEVMRALRQIGQAQSLMGDAVTRLQSSFEGLGRHTTEQHELIVGLMGLLADQPSPAEQGHDVSDDGESRAGEDAPLPRMRAETFARETSSVLAQFIDLLTTVSSQSIRTVFRMDDMAKELDGVFNLLGNIDEIADETFLLAVNATIEAAHSGDKRQTFSVIANNVRDLSKRTRKFSGEIATQIDRTRKVVEEVRGRIGEMASRDMNVALAGKMRIEEMLVSLQESEVALRAMIERARATSKNVVEASAQAVMGLQFEDIIGQVLTKASQRIDRVGQVCQALATAARGAEEATPAHVVKEQLLELCSAAEREASDPVRQRSMDAGSLDLFT